MNNNEENKTNLNSEFQSQNINQFQNPIQQNQNFNTPEHRKVTNGLAIAGLVCSLCGIITCGITSIIGLILSILGFSKSKKLDGEGKGLAIGGIISGAVIIIIYVLILALTTTGVIALVDSVDKTFGDDYIEENITPKTKKYGLGDTFEFEDFRITIGDAYTFATIDKEYSEYYNQPCIKLPITVLNQDDETSGLYLYQVYGSKGTNVDYFDYYFEDGLSGAGQLRSGASYSKYMYIQYDGDGKYAIEFNDYDDKVTVEFDVTK